MSFSKVLTSFAVFMGVLCASQSHAESVVGTDAIFNEQDLAFESQFHQMLDEAKVPGGAFAIVRDGQIVMARGHGIRELGQTSKIDSNTVFRIASVSKTFAAQLTALLVQEGKLHWDDGVSQFVPEFQLKGKGQAQRLQVQHILGQSTGLVPNAYDNLLNANQPLQKILPHFKSLEPLCSPGQCYSYQNVMFSLIDPVVEKATKKDYGTLIKERIFVPLKMEQSSIGMSDYLASINHASPHIKRQKQWRTTKIQTGYYHVPPAAGVNASVNDLGKWLIAQMGYQPDIIPPSLVEELTRKRVRTEKDLNRREWRELLTDAHYGIGWRIYQIGGEEIYMHSGWVEGFVADIAYSRKHKTGLVVLLNAEAGVISEITTSFWRAVLAEELALRNEKKTKRKVKKSK